MRAFFNVSTFVIAGCLAACGGLTKEPAESVSVDALHTQTRVLGEIQAGELRETDYASSPSLRAYYFFAEPGEHVDVWVRSENADAIAWIIDELGNVVAHNDDADATTLDAHLDFETSDASEYYFILFREYYRRAARISVSFELQSAVCSDETPGRQYIGHDTQECATILFMCAPGLRPFTSDCGCGCEPDAAACNPAGEANRNYIGASTEECARIRFMCVPGTHHFANDCGCGCEND
jgi:hypothetical protein